MRTRLKALLRRHRRRIGLVALVAALVCTSYPDGPVAPGVASAGPGAGLSGALAVLRAYTRAFAMGRYDAMWALLTPAARAGWGGIDGYARYYRAKFAPVTTRTVSIGAPRLRAGDVVAPISFDLAWRDGGPPGVLSLFRNVDAFVVRMPEGWRVSKGGPLDPAAPFIPPPQAPPRVLRVPILMYHHISDAPPLALSQVGLTVTDRDFAAQLDYLAAHGYRTVRLIDLFNALYYGRPLPPRPVVLTFDDGYLDAYTDAFPLLRRHHMIGEFNIITGYCGLVVGVNRYMTWPQIAGMARAGMEMESHTIDHPDLGVIGDAKIRYELRFSRGILAAHIHHAVQFLAYPSGEPFRSGSLWARWRILALLPRYGYVGALLDQRVPSVWQDAGTPYELPRVRILRGETLDQLAASLGM